MCAGIARRTNLDPLIIRGLALVVALFGGPVLFLYALAWLLLPDARGKIHLERVTQGVVEGPTIAIGAVMLVSFFPAFQGLWWAGPPGWWGMPDWLEVTFRLAWGVLVTGGVIWLIIVIAQRAQRDGWGRGYRGPDAPHGYPYYGPTGEPGGNPSAGEPPTATTPPPTADGPIADGPTGSTNPAAPGHDSTPGASGANTSQSTATGGYPPRTSEWHRIQAEKNRQRAEARADRATRWQARGDQRATHHGEREEYHRRRPEAAFVAIFLGVALIAGTLTAALTGYLGTAPLTGSAATAFGAAVALAVVGVGVVIAGIRGRHSSGLGFAAFCLMAATLVFGVFPTGTQFMPLGTPEWNVTSAPAGETQGFVLLGGTATLDLSTLDSRAADTGGDVTLWLGGGVTRVILPNEGTIVVESNAFAGSVSYGSLGNGTSRSGALVSERIVVRDGTVLSAGTAIPVNTTTVRLWYAAGNADISIKN
ncbi:hypothetical protein GCM10022198_21340 [Klugiella xanthotipulae]